VRNASGGWFEVNSSSGYSLEGGVLTLFNIDTVDVKEVFIKFEGRMLGDVVGEDGEVDLIDAIAIARSLVPGGGELTGNAEFYGDVNDDMSTDLLDAITIARYQIPNQFDDNYQLL